MERKICTGEEIRARIWRNNQENKRIRVSRVSITLYTLLPFDISAFRLKVQVTHRKIVKKWDLISTILLNENKSRYEAIEKDLICR